MNQKNGLGSVLKRIKYGIPIWRISNILFGPPQIILFPIYFIVWIHYRLVSIWVRFCTFSGSITSIVPVPPEIKILEESKLAFYVYKNE